MPLPKDIDNRIRKRFNDLISEAETLINDMIIADRAWHEHGILKREINSPQARAEALIFKVISLVGQVLETNSRASQITQDFRRTPRDSYGIQQILGTLRGLKDDYENGMLDQLHQIIETSIISDYMEQAHQLLDEDRSGQTYISAAVLAGAFLENALRRLCDRQTPPINTVKDSGEKKTLDPLITDLQKANVFNKAKADQLKSWAKIRNYAAHGEFTELTRNDVEAMIKGIQNFLADYL